MSRKFSEAVRRSLVKAVTFRVLIMSFDLALVWVLTKSVELAVTTAVGLGIVHSVLYFLHERFWDEMEWGRKGTK